MGRGKTHGKKKTYILLLLFHRSSLEITLRMGRNHPRLLAAVGKGGEGDVVQRGRSRGGAQE
jgi:hypothetical protein